MEKCSSKQNGFQIELKTSPEKITWKEFTQLMLIIRNPEGEIVKGLQLIHEKPVHLIIVSEDLNEFIHLHPTVQPDGSYLISHVFPFGGTYILYVNLITRGIPVQKRLSLNVRGHTRSIVPLVPDAHQVKTVNGMHISMKSTPPLCSNQKLKLSFSLKDQKTDEPVSDLQEYMGAMGHFAIINSNKELICHTDSTENFETTQFEQYPLLVSRHNQNPLNISCSVIFPNPGLYKLWAQFQHKNMIVTVPFVLDIPI